MNWDADRYDDDRELTEYIWDNFGSLMTDLERRAARTLVAEAKASASPGRVANVLRERWGRHSDPEVARALEQGADAFRRRVRDRILSEMGDAVIVNRCAACDRIVATPRARQCLWCGHDWHST